MKETILRLWTMLRMLPRSPRKIDMATLERQLRDEGYTVTRRTVQRDLQQLAQIKEQLWMESLAAHVRAPAAPPA